MTHEREITEPVDLCGPDGRLNPAAVGWSRRPLHRANLRGWGRAKRWEYWGVVTPTHILGLVASSLDYAGVHSVYLLDRRTGVERTTEASAATDIVSGHSSRGSCSTVSNSPSGRRRSTALCS
ncbi:DUF2804 family protein [Micromonospora sp. AP08]|uniref:DUF2804 family protein n=1 Tax=Micromonospora sp. AP08 TaxID=2604467 RepID=UPI0021073646|nr:DUF2804 family protein [Micromonospora sp. AP08]